MPILNTFTLLVNGLTLALALGFLLIVLWQDSRNELNQFFAIFLILVTLWNAGALLLQVAALVAPDSPLVAPAIGLLELGFTGSSIAVYALTTVLVKIYNRRFRLLVFASIGLILAYRVLLILSNAPAPFTVSADGSIDYQAQPFVAVFYMIYDTITVFLVWRYKRKIRSRGLMIGIALFVVAQSLGFLNPELNAFSLSIIAGSIAALIISFSVLRQEIIVPLAERVSQVESMYRVSLAITSQLSAEAVLDEIATQAASWLTADAACIFLRDDDGLLLAAAYNLPPLVLHQRLAVGQGMAGLVALTRKPIFLENYDRDWHGEPDLPLAHETFGAVIGTPLTFGDDVIGILMVIAGRQSRTFQRDDARLLELLGSQAAVAISHSRLFAEQRQLTTAVEAARSQLETLLVSTENPVVAISRDFRIIFANPSAISLFGLDPTANQTAAILPVTAFPPDFMQMFRDVRRKRVHIYEVSLDDKIYLCHLARLGGARLTGWVAVLNDVTQLKELDRIKSEMVRMTSHDLKNPLQAAFANLDLLRDDLGKDVNAEVAESVDNIEKQLERMNRIISGILDLERVRAGAIMTESCSPVRIVKNTLDELRQNALDRQITIETEIGDDLPSFTGNHEQFQRALINLVENAIKFTPAGGRVTLSVYRDDKVLLFSVADTGVGISEEMHHKVFDRFFRGNQKGVEHVTGSGLGLSLVKAVVENHHGRLWLESEVGVGTTFFISLPLAVQIDAAPREQKV